MAARNRLMRRSLLVMVPDFSNHVAAGSTMSAIAVVAVGPTGQRLSLDDAATTTVTTT